MEPILNVNKDPEYKTWASMKERCAKKTLSSYHRYGGRGIKVCDRWLASYFNFLEDMGTRPEKSFQLDRIDNDGDYEPSNCRWVSPKENARNKHNNLNITYNGKTQCVAAWAEEVGMSWSKLWGRIKLGYTPAQALGFETKSKVRMGKRKLITYNQVTKSLGEWADDLGLSSNSLQKRIDSGWSLADALTRARDPTKATSKPTRKT